MRNVVDSHIDIFLNVVWLVGDHRRTGVHIESLHLCPVVSRDVFTPQIEDDAVPIPAL